MQIEVHLLYNELDNDGLVKPNREGTDLVRGGEGGGKEFPTFRFRAVPQPSFHLLIEDDWVESRDVQSSGKVGELTVDRVYIGSLGRINQQHLA